MKIILDTVFILALSIIAIKYSFSFEKDNYNTNLQIVNKNNHTSFFKVKVADNNSSRQYGLMFIEDMPSKYGMLFKFEKESIIYMWMKNTKISLDMIFIDADNQIVHIERSTIPESLKKISSKFRVNQVLEINGGLSKKLDIQVGDLVKVLN